MIGEAEHHYRVATTTDTVDEGFRFILSHLDAIDDPTISISPIWIYSGGDDTHGVRRFECSISGTPKVRLEPT